MSAITLQPAQAFLALESLPTSQKSLEILSTPEPSALLQTIQTALQSTHLTVQRIDDLPHNFHHVHLLQLSNKSHVVLKISPPSTVPLLRHEREGLDAEALALELLDRSGLPIPSIIKHEKTRKVLGSSFLLTTRLRGSPLVDVLPTLSRADRSGIERQISILTTTIAQHTSSAFGPIYMVSAGHGYGSWREAFRWMFESILKDAEDVLVNLPYSQIREQIGRAEAALDYVREARLVILDLGEADKVLIDARTKEITGISEFKQVIWGDPTMGTMEGKDDTRCLL